MSGGDREKGVISDYQKWDFITLSDFRVRSCKSPLSYGWLWFLAILSVAVYAADTFTAVNLLVYDRWSSQINPSIPLHISKWIFAGCIIFSWLLCGYEWIRALRVINRGGVADSYLDPLAATLQSIRIGKSGRGWRRFLVFAELTKSRKGADYIALFVYFQFKGAVRIILAEGPRQVVNALTLYSVMQANLIPTGTHAATHGHSAFTQFWYNLQILADQHLEESIILFSMLFTLVVWLISALSLVVATVLYITFLWHYIPQSEARLSTYCRRKIDRRLEKIVSTKLRKGLEQESLQQHGSKSKKKGVNVSVMELRGPMLPDISDSAGDVKLAALSRATSQTTLTSQTRRIPPGGWDSSLPMLEEQGVQMSRSTSATSQGEVNSVRASERALLSGASPMGYRGPTDEPSRPAFFIRPTELLNQPLQYNHTPIPSQTDGSPFSNPPPTGITRNFSRLGPRPNFNTSSYRRPPTNLNPPQPALPPEGIYELDSSHQSPKTTTTQYHYPQPTPPYQPQAYTPYRPSAPLAAYAVPTNHFPDLRSPNPPHRAATQHERKVVHFATPRRVATAPPPSSADAGAFVHGSVARPGAWQDGAVGGCMMRSDAPGLEPGRRIVYERAYRRDAQRSYHY